jgi:hypothetical protein
MPVPGGPDAPPWTLPPDGPVDPGTANGGGGGGGGSSGNDPWTKGKNFTKPEYKLAPAGEVRDVNEAY